MGFPDPKNSFFTLQKSSMSLKLEEKCSSLAGIFLKFCLNIEKEIMLNKSKYTEIIISRKGLGNRNLQALVDCEVEEIRGRLCHFLTGDRELGTGDEK